MSKSRRNNIAPLIISCGEPAGIGPDVTLMAAMQSLSHPVVAIADKTLLCQRALQLNLTINFTDYTEQDLPVHQPGTLPIIHRPLKKPCQQGVLDLDNGAYVIDGLKTSSKLCLDKKFSGLVTAPVHKACLQDAGFNFSGHTEYLAKLSGIKRVVMLFVSPTLKVALATTHLALRDVASAITQPLLIETLTIINQQLQAYFKLKAPRILVCGLNPHAGESGHLGHEEIDTIIPALKACKQQGINVIGPLPADTAFTPQQLAQADVVLAMYHDQGLPAVKQQGFGDAVNVTLGLPFIRTSVDHGTALSLAGLGHANPQSLISAIECAHQMELNHANPSRA